MEKNENCKEDWLQKLFNWIDENNILSEIHASHYNEWTGQYREGNENEGLLEKKSDLVIIEALNLINKGLTELPKEIGKLTNLKALYITANDITYLPDEIMQLTNLEEFYFVKNYNLVLTAEQKDWIDTLNVGDSMIEYLEGENEQYLMRRLEIIKLALMLGDEELIKSQIEKTKSFRIPELLKVLSRIEEHFTTYPSKENDNLISLVNRYLHKIGDDDYFYGQMDKAETIRREIFENN